MATEKIMEVRGGGHTLSVQEVRTRITAYENQIRQYLDSLEANVEGYKFTVEKQGDGLVIDVAVRATIHPKNKAGISK